MPSLSDEEENYIRMSFLLTGLSTRAVRALFDKEFPPIDLISTLYQKYMTLLSLQKSRVINQKQWNLLFPPRPGVAESKTFDVTLMICLLRHITCIRPPALGFDHLPSSGETSPGADIARIKYYRNYMSHLDDTKIDNQYFTTAWKDVSDAVGRLGGPSMYHECQDLKTKFVKQPNHEPILKLIEKQTDTVPWNIREQVITTLEGWKTEDEMFVKTRAASHVLKCIKMHSFVTVTASSGVGKTFTVRHVAFQMAADGYDILPVTNPEDIIKYHNPHKKTLYVIDDLCGTYTVNETNLDKWKTTHQDIKELLKNKTAKIIASCRLQVYKDEQFKSLPLFATCQCNILLSKQERQLLAEKYLGENANEIGDYIGLFDFFPLLCKLYKENQKVNIVDFFKNPFSVYEIELDKLKTEKAYGKYCSLALCVMFNNHLEEEWLTEDTNEETKQIIENTCEACKLSRGTSKLMLLDELESLTHTFLKKEQGFYRTIHDKVFDFLVFYFGKTPIVQCLIKNADSQMISQRFLFERKKDSERFITIISEKYHHMFIERMFRDWSNNKVVKVFTNINMESPQFRKTFLKYLKQLDITYQKQLASKYDIDVDAELYEKGDYGAVLAYNSRMNTPLLHCCVINDVSMVDWCCSCGADLNCCSDNGESPLYIACNGGCTDIVNKLVDNKADVNNCALSGESPLYIACIRGYKDIVTKLVDNNADINKSTQRGESPLYVACNGGHTDIVNKLVDNKADINMFTVDGESPLYIACYHGKKDIVTKLVDNKADINKCTTYETSPLYISCDKGFTDIVTELVDNKADINKCKNEMSPLYISCKKGFTAIVTKLVDKQADVNRCTRYKETPLYIACKGGFTDIVTKLVDNKADINMCTDDGESPLYIACYGGFTDIVAKLVDKQADVNRCTRYKETPLYIACKGGVTGIVTKLVDNKADINMCTDDGESPLYIACNGGFTDIVNKLVENKADINKCSKWGASPLYIACKGGFTDIVTKLVDNQADINKCTEDGESPLCMACIGGYKVIVTKLVDNKADINMCTDDGESPLYIACKGGFTDIVTYLIDNKADINMCTNYGASPLYVACNGGFTDIVTRLVGNGADINKCTKDGKSPLYAACNGGYTDIVTKLVGNADVKKCTKDRKSPLYLDHLSAPMVFIGVGFLTFCCFVFMSRLQKLWEI